MALPVKGIVTGAMKVVEVFGIKDLVQLGATLTQQGIDAGARAHAKKQEDKRNIVKIPAIIDADYSLGLQDAKRWLEEDGLNVETVVVKPDVKYKDCSPFEVVSTNYRINQKVKKGERVILKYVTAEVIEESRKLYNEREEEKNKIAEQKKQKKIENKQKVDETLSTMKKGIGDAVSTTQQNIAGAASKISKRKTNEI